MRKMTVSRLRERYAQNNLLTCVTWKGVDYKLPEDDETCRSVIICEIIVHLLVIVQNNKRCTVDVRK